MPIKLPKRKPRSASPPPNRRRGQPADVGRAVIVEAALALIEKDALFSINALAKALGVFPGAIHFHFPGAGAKAQLGTEMVRVALRPVARGFRPKDNGYDYLRELFWSVRRTFHGHQNLAQLVASELSANLLISPLLLERTLAALKDAGLDDDRLMEGVERIMASLIGLLALEFPPRRHEIASDWVDDFETDLRGLPDDGDYASVRGYADDLLAHAAARLARLSQPQADKARIDGFAQSVLQGLGLAPGGQTRRNTRSR